jgi:SpoIID/LytB domain protein
MSSRRGFLVGTASAAVCSQLWVPGRARGSDLGLSDRIDLLYSNQFHFNERGEPQITVGIVQGRKQVRLEAKGGLRVLPSGDGGTAIDGGTRYVIDLVQGKPARQRFAVVLDELTGVDPRAIESAAAKWRKLGLDTSDHEVGTVFGVSGRVLDTRHVLLVTGSYSSEDSARERVTELRRAHGVLGKLHPRVIERSSGSMSAHDLDRDIRVRADGVLWFVARDGGPVTVRGVTPDTTSGAGTPEDREYWGSIYIAIDRRGTLAVANLASESELLAGLVPAEIFASAPTESLKAQAVAARGQLVAKVGTRHLDDPFLLCSEQHCQVYAGRAKEHERTTAAVHDTVGWIAMRPDGTHLVDTVYSANSGGHSEDNDAVWPAHADPQLRASADPLLDRRFARGISNDNLAEWLRTSPRSFSRPEEGDGAAYRWKTSLDPAAIAGNPGVPEDFGPVRAIEVRARGRSGRAIRVALVGEKQTLEIAGELRIRRALGGLKSSMFMVLRERDDGGRLQLIGGGHGHGVGLCQHGAMGMARAGKTYKEILAHYYAKSKLVKLW